MKKSYRTYRKRENHIDKKYDILKTDYINSHTEYTYQAKLFYNRDIAYSVYFALYIIAIAILYYFIFKENSLEHSDVLFIVTEKFLEITIILFVGVSYAFIIAIYLDSFRKMVKSKHRVMLAAKSINELFKEDVIKWEGEFKCTFQSLNDSPDINYPNTSFIKILYALILYCVVEVSLIFLCFYTFKINVITAVFAVGISIASGFLFFYWYRIWYILIKNYKKELYDIL